MKKGMTLVKFNFPTNYWSTLEFALGAVGIGYASTSVRVCEKSTGNYEAELPIMELDDEQKQYIINCIKEKTGIEPVLVEN